MKEIEELIKLAEYKNRIDLQKGREAYNDITWLLNEIKAEVDEVKEEIQEQNTPFLEDELGDILWALFMLIQKLKEKNLISSHENIIKRALKKYQERVLSIKGQSLEEDEKIWQAVKTKQKKQLQEEKEELKNS